MLLGKVWLVQVNGSTIFSRITLSITTVIILILNIITLIIVRQHNARHNETQNDKAFKMLFHYVECHCTKCPMIFNIEYHWTMCHCAGCRGAKYKRYLDG